MYHSIYRTDSPLSYTSITPTGTPELSGLSPAPRPKLRVASVSLPHDENAAPHQHHYQQQQHSHLHATPLPKNHTPSTASGSTSSRATFWSAAGSVDLGEEHDPMPVAEADSGILVLPILPLSPNGRRESASSDSTTAPSSHSTKIRKMHPKSTQSPRSDPAPQPRHPSRQSTSTSTWTSSSSSTAVPPKLSRSSTETTVRSPPRAYTKPSRAEIATSLQQKYPNDRCHGAFLPFRSEFSHSKDSLCPVRFISTPGLPISPTSPGFTEKPVPPTPVAEAYNGPVMYNTPIDWKGNAARRREYAAADRKQCGWRRWCCGLFGRGNNKVFWNGDDGGSVRRYRLDLPPENSEDGIVEEKDPLGEESAGRMVLGMRIEARAAERWGAGEGRERNV